MELWTEYEGRTIDGVFPLKKLLLPEGRSAFFSTSNGNGDPTVIRLIEPHFDADEILARWRGVQALGHPNLLKLEQFGQLAMDGTTVIYAVMEPVDTNLGEVVSGQRLTIPETKQLADSLTSALDVLHMHGFVHEHVEPANVFAVGDVVKLRSDCVREAPEGEEGVEAKRRDVHDLAVVLLQAITQERTLVAAARELPLPSPFDQIVGKSMSGVWGVAEIQAALQTSKRPSAPSPASFPYPMRTAVDQPAAHSARRISLSNPVVPESKAINVAPPGDFFHLTAEDGLRRTVLRTRLIVAVGPVVVLALLLGWHFAHSGSANREGAKQLNSNSASKTAPSVGTTAIPTAGIEHEPVQNNAVTAIRAQWRVVAFTYNHEEQAQKKSATIAQEHPELRPDVFTPSGNAPYLVTVGGVMNRVDALAFVQKARNCGLPSDTYAQNYSGKVR
jgi:hypothetical protein